MTLDEIKDRLDYQRELYPQWITWHDAIDALIEGARKSDLDAPPVAGKAKASKDAAFKLEPHVGTIRRKVLDVIRRVSSLSAQGASCSDIVSTLNSRHQTISARLTELHQGGWIKDSGRTRENERGFAETVWVVK